MTTVNEMFAKYIHDVLPSKAPRTQKDYASHLAHLAKHFGHMDVNDIRPRDIGMFLDVPKGKIQRNRSISVFSAVFTKAVGRWYMAERNPCIGVEKNEAHRRTRYITDEEFSLVYKAMGERVQIAMDLALLTGQRQGDLLKLRWEDVSPEGIFFQQNKTGKKLRVALSPTLSAVLDRARKLSPDLPREYVIRSKSGERYTSEGFRAVWQRKMRKLTQGYWRKPRLKERHWNEPRLQRFTFHDIRAKCVSDTKDIQSAFERAGHTNIALTRGIYDRGTRTVTPLR